MTIHSLFQVIFVLWITIELADATSIAKPGCLESCGDVSIPYPFGIGASCYKNEGFAVSCNYSSNPPSAMLTSCGMELLGVSPAGFAKVNNLVESSNCTSIRNFAGADLSVSPFVFASSRNRFTAIGCSNYATLVTQEGVVGGCMSTCLNRNTSGCYGVNCCQSMIPPYMKAFVAYLIDVSIYGEGDRCKLAFIADQDWFNSKTLAELRPMLNVPAVLEWATDQGSCNIFNSSMIFCSSNGYCWTDVGESHLCVCGQRFFQDEVNISYVVGSCQGCKGTEYSSCHLLCLYTMNSQNCTCPDGFDTYGNQCVPLNSSQQLDITRTVQTKILIISSTSSIGLLLLVFGSWWGFDMLKRKRAIKLKEKYFKRNGGLLLQQQILSGEKNVDHVKLFTSKELEKATDNYNVNRILGQGGQGIVFKGMLMDGMIVAIKKSRIGNEGQVVQFINEVVILSQINHRNVVKLLGFCLETEVPLLVYEFIPNGTLTQLLQDQNEEFPVTWEMRLRIAIEIADAISYLHSAASVPIYHRDIKSSNILLDDKYRVKVSDFGTSKSIEVDQTHVTTKVQGTIGYLDPEYFQSSQFTEKSDVYSFGVVLSELLTGRKPISSAQSDEERISVVTYFLSLMEANRLFEIVDARVLKDGNKEEIVAVAKLARRCLNLNGKKRPTMKCVLMELESIKASEAKTSSNETEYDAIDYSYESNSSGSGSWNLTTSYVQSALDVFPLLDDIC